ncbi:putative ARG4-arginosuccinate lyase [Cladochytrium replicatum]|nr:putative ARG4-arginosuccinate lyase [Cladochytrium replicatum]
MGSGDDNGDHKTWGGKTEPLKEKFNDSINFDKRMWKADIQGSQTYAKALALSGIISAKERDAIVTGPDAVGKEWESDTFVIKPTDEDIHTANERRLGEATGRSRNDQVATDMRIWVSEATETLLQHLKSLISVIVNRANAELDMIIPRCTHLQCGQPVLWSHWLLSYSWYFQADAIPLTQIRERTSSLPLGSGALARNPFRVNQDLILYSTAEFGFVGLADADADSWELIRGKTGDMCGFMMTLKGLPSTYNKDLQEDKEPIFDAYDTLNGCLQLATGVLSTLKLSHDLLSTDLAEYLVRRRVPFRETHHTLGQAVRLEENCTSLGKLTVTDLRTLHSAFEEDVNEVWDFARSVEKGYAYGGTSKTAVLVQIDELDKCLA